MLRKELFNELVTLFKMELKNRLKVCEYKIFVEFVNGEQCFVEIGEDINEK